MRRDSKRTGRAPAARDTSWEASASWYDRLVGEAGSEYHREVIFDSAVRMLGPMRGERVLDIGCGQGVFARLLRSRGCSVTGVDASRSLIESARSYENTKESKLGRIDYRCLDAASLDGLPDGQFDAASAILCIQNMARLDQVAGECSRVLSREGRMLWVINHPYFRIPRQSAWGFDEAKKLQYRRVDLYMSPLEIPIAMHPGRRGSSEATVSFHRSLQEMFEVMRHSGFLLSGIEEWCSHKKSDPGPRARAEDRARREFPLFMGLLWQKLPPRKTPAEKDA